MKPSTKTWIDTHHPSLHLFNPGYEPGLLPGNRNYMPPKNVQRMREELALLPFWFAEKGDYIWVESIGSLEFFAGLPEEIVQRANIVSRQIWENTDRHIPPLQAAPWGISPQNRQFFEDLSIIPGREVLVSAWKEEYATLSGRQTAAHCLDIIRQKATTPLPETPFFLYSIDELSEYITTHTPPFVLKMPFSSSGRGLLRLDDRIPDKEREWISGAFRKQGSLSIEKRLRKEKDFALEFELDIAGNIRYHGISLFETAGWKTYCGNLLAGQQEMEEEIINLVGEAPFREIKRLVGEVVQEVFGGIYSGYLGVDMMVYSDDEGAFRIHPCVEINMRYTMGMVAIRLFENYIDPAAKGLFQVVYERDAWQRHREMQQAHPQKWKSGKLLSGYLPLTPVISSTQYRAFVLIA